MSLEATPAGTDPAPHIYRALAALREAAEHLEDAAAASEHAVLGVTSALSHVDAARTALRPRGFGTIPDVPDRDAA